MTICGIDPGQTGGVAFINGQITGPRQILSLAPMPDLRDLFNLFCDHDTAHVFIEKAQTMPKQGISSAFTYGRHFGELIGLVVALKIPFTLVPPREWTKVIHSGTDSSGSPKERTLEACRSLYPDANLLATPRSKVPHAGMFDALMIAEYGLRKTIGVMNRDPVLVSNL